MRARAATTARWNEVDPMTAIGSSLFTRISRFPRSCTQLLPRHVDKTRMTTKETRWKAERSRPNDRHRVDFVPYRALAWHVTMRLRVDRVLTTSPAGFRAASRAIVKQGSRCGLLVHRVVDTHVHAVVACARREAGLFALYTESALSRVLRLPVPFEPARFTPIVELRHLYHAVRYVLRQDERHGTSIDSTHDGSTLPDLLGMRCIFAGAFERLSQALPRLDPEELDALLGVPDLPRAPLLAEHLAEGAAAALALPDLRGNDPERATLRRGAVAAAHDMLETAEIADALAITERAVMKMRNERAPLALVEAIRRQVRLRSLLGPSTPRAAPQYGPFGYG